MSEDSKIFVAYLTSGLGNRLRPLASALAYCARTGRQLRVYWDQITPNGCLTPLDALFKNRFEPITLAELEALSATRSVGLFTEKGPGHGVQREAERFGRPELSRISARHPAQPCTAIAVDSPQDIVVVYDNNYLSCLPTEESIRHLRSLDPSDAVRERVAAVVSDLGLTPAVKGVHARGTDFGLASALELYAGLIKGSIAVEQGEKFFLSTDDKDLEQGIRNLFPGNILTRHDRLHLSLNEGKDSWFDPDSFTISADHGLDALIDIYLLSCTNLVVFHPGSTFGEIARHLHNVLLPPHPTMEQPSTISKQHPAALAAIREEFNARAAKLVARGASPFPDGLNEGASGPLYLDSLSPAFYYWESLGYQIPILERMFTSSNSRPFLEWDGNLFTTLVATAREEAPFAVFDSLSPYSEAIPQLAVLRPYIQGRKILIVGSESYWLELFSAICGAAEITTVEYREIRWSSTPRCASKLTTITWDTFTEELDHHIQGYDLILTYSSIEHSGLGRYGDRIMPMGDLFTFLIMSKCLRPHGMTVVAVPTGKDLTHFNAHRIYGEKRIRALADIAGMNFIGIAFPDAGYLQTQEPEDYLKEGWTLDRLFQLPLGKLRQPLLCFAYPGFSTDQYFNASMSQPAARTANPHQAALDAVASALGSRKFVEITHQVPFGFDELNTQRINISVSQIPLLSNTETQGIEDCVIHVLLGCGVPFDGLLQALRWALPRFARIHVLEHNAASNDWNSPAIREEHCIDNCIGWQTLRQALALLTTAPLDTRLIPGTDSPDRNVLISLSGRDKAIPYGDAPGVLAALGVQQTGIGNASFSNWNDVYLGTAESTQLTARYRHRMKELRGSFSGKRLFASCGGFFSLDMLEEASLHRFSQIVFFDVNSFTVTFCQTIIKLIMNSSSRHEFLRNYLLAEIVFDESRNVFCIDTNTPFSKRLIIGASLSEYYHESIKPILITLLSAELSENGLIVRGMRNVSDNRTDSKGLLEIHCNKENFTNTNALINGNQSWLSSEQSFINVKHFLQNISITFTCCSLDAIQSNSDDMILSSNIKDFVPNNFLQNINGILI